MTLRPVLTGSALAKLTLAGFPSSSGWEQVRHHTPATGAVRVTRWVGGHALPGKRACTSTSAAIGLDLATV